MSYKEGKKLHKTAYCNADNHTACSGNCECGCHKKCSGCKHGAKFHYKTIVDGRPITEGPGGLFTHNVVICSKDNCHAWNRCDQEGWEDSTLLGKQK